MKTLSIYSLKGGLIIPNMKQSIILDYFVHSKLDPDYSSSKRKSQIHPDQKSIKNIEPSCKKPIMQVPASTLPILSNSTLQILNSLNLPNLLKPQNNLRTSDQILSSVRPREKYSELIEAGRKLALPYKYKRLLQMQEYLDCSINTAKARGYLSEFERIKENIRATYEVFIDLEHLKKIRYLEKDLYRFWTENGKLCIDFSSGDVLGISDLHWRNSQVKRKMIEIVKKAHQGHLDTIGIKFDPDLYKTWHSSFNLHEIDDVPEDASFYLEMKNIEKDAIENDAKETKDDRKGGAGRCYRLILCSAMVLKVFKSSKTPSLFSRSLCKKILVNKKEDQEEFNWESESKKVLYDLIEISQVFPDWINFIKTDSGEVIRYNRSFNLSSKEIQTKLKSIYQVE